MRVERKYDFFETPRFRQALQKAFLNEFEKEMVIYEFEIPIMFRKFRIVFEVDKIDAFGLDFAEV